MSLDTNNKNISTLSINDESNQNIPADDNEAVAEAREEDGGSRHDAVDDLDHDLVAVYRSCERDGEVNYAH